MATSKYSYMGSKVILTMEDHNAELYNEAIDEWFDAQRRFEAEHGRKVTPGELMSGELQFRLNRDQVRVYNAVANVMNKLVKKGLVLTEEDMPEDRLVKIE